MCWRRLRRPTVCWPIPSGGADEDSGQRTPNSVHNEVDTYLESLVHYEFVPFLENEIEFLQNKTDVVAFVDFLEALALQHGKYIS